MTTIFIEAKDKNTSEYIFIESLLKYLGVDSSLYQIQPVNGKDNLKNMKVQFEQNSILGIKNIIIFDADYPQTNGGYQSRKNELYQVGKTNGMVIEDIFLYPNNHDDGIFENLLEELMLKDVHKKWIDCYTDYESCLGNDYLAPNIKGKLYTYISSQKTLSKTKRNNLGHGHWLFEDSRFWNLEAPYLTPLKTFLLQYLSKSGAKKPLVAE